ncbi:hypothetical protein NUSPORA_01252 [Nucleospora cyclopteri]
MKIFLIPMTIYCGKPNFIFKYGEMSCALNDKFNIVIYSNNTAYYHGTAQTLGILVPTDYVSFIKRLNKKYTIQTKVSEIFKFRNQKEKDIFQKFIDINYNKEFL